MMGQGVVGVYWIKTLHFLGSIVIPCENVMITKGLKCNHYHDLEMQYLKMISSQYLLVF